MDRRPPSARACAALSAVLLFLALFLSVPLTLAKEGPAVDPEDGYGNFTCLECDNGKMCVTPVQLCDGLYDCEDKSDESPATCNSSFSCSDTGRTECPGATDPLQCMYGWQPCNSVEDCPGGADESPALCTNFECINGMSQCPSGVGCTWSANFCDGKKDCIDGSDEDPSFCPSFNCSSAYKELCPSLGGKRSTQCVDSFLLCNGKEDCPGGTDEGEAFCANSSFNCSDTGRMECPGGVGCMEERFACDRKRDCPGGSDEDPSFCRSFDCITIGLVKCPSGDQCMDQGNMCNGVKDCWDGSDESPNNCASYNCSDTFRVSCPPAPGEEAQCIGAVSLCDGNKDCATGSDEDAAFCADYTCPLGFFKCPGTGTCAPGTLCDGAPQCALNGNGVAGDEDPEFCRAYSCPENMTKCADGLVCIDDYAMCNGVPDCKGGSDEDPATCLDFDCAATSRVPCPSGSFCLPDYCAVCTDYAAMCPDGSDQWNTSCSLRDNSTCFLHEPFGSTPGNCGAPGVYCGALGGTRGKGGGFGPHGPPQLDDPSGLARDRARAKRRRRSKLRRRVKRVRKVRRVRRKKVGGTRKVVWGRKSRMQYGMKKVQGQGN